MRVLVCGSRAEHDHKKVGYVLNGYPITEIIEGGERGVDYIARMWSAANGVPRQTFKAEWEKYGNSAGPKRNQQMLDEGKPELVIAFPAETSRGTWDMIRKAERAGVRVVIV